jgi:hypothetical protein
MSNAWRRFLFHAFPGAGCNASQSSVIFHFVDSACCMSRDYAAAGRLSPAVQSDK